MGQGPLEIKLRVPGWIRNGFDVTINGQAQPTKDVRGSTYVSLNRNWESGDVIQVRMPFIVRVERALDRPDTQAIMWGPVLLQTVGKPVNGSYWQLSLYQYLKRDGDYQRVAVRHTGKTSTGDPVFTTTSTSGGGVKLRPYYMSDTQAVSTYFRRVEPTVIFGTINTGVPNRKRNDGLPNYDVPVAGVTSPGTDGPTFLDLIWDQAPFSTHVAFIDVVILTADAFVAANVYTAKERDTIVAKVNEAEMALTP